MITTEFRNLLQSSRAVFSDTSNEVTSFGDSAAELEASQTGAALFVVSDLIRIRLVGRDRSKFLHNFCTGNVKAMVAGDVVEAFLTDVKARVLGHGYVVAFPECIELWMLPGDALGVEKHLQKYIIVEDVEVSVVEPTVAFCLAGPEAFQVFATWQSTPTPKAGNCVVTEVCAAIAVEWNRQPLLMLSVSDSQKAAEIWSYLSSAGTQAAGQVAFEAMRIAERFPRVDVDLSNSHMAPEAGRNQSAICYTKGCYLGQEPIARLDAMGHVNKQLYSGTIQPYLGEMPDDTKKWPLVTSMVRLSPDLIPALAMLPVKSTTSGEPVVCRTVDGQFWNFSVTQDVESS